MKSSLLFGAVAAVVCFAPGAMALSPAEVEQKAKAVSVKMLTSKGSGVIIHRQGSLYTVITNSHVVCKLKKLCTDREIHSLYRLKTPDDRTYQVAKSNIKLLKDSAGKPLDLAIVQFRSSRSYPIAQVADSGGLKVGDAVYTAGFPQGQGWLFGTGQAQAVVNRRLLGDSGGYTIVYDAETLPGMSGGGAFDSNGLLVAVHGYGDKYTENTQAEVEPSNTFKASLGNKIGINRGIPIRWVVKGLSDQGISLGGRRPIDRAASTLPNRTNAGQATADEFFIAGFNKFVDPGEDFQAGKKEAVELLNRSVAINPRYVIAYFFRAYIKNQLNDPQGALADCDKAISLNPQAAVYTIYILRGTLKQEKLNDSQGALADYDKAIALNPQAAIAYSNRGFLRYQKLNDPQGALVDFNQALALNPQSAVVYYNRGTLKYQKLNNPQGALADYNQAISLNPKLAEAYSNRGLLKNSINDSKGALADYDQAISLNPKLAEAYYNRGNLKYVKLNNPQGALADYNQAVSLNPKLAEAYITRGNLKDDLNDPQGALVDYNQAIALNSQDAAFYNTRGNLKFGKLNDPQGALSDFNQAIALDPQNAIAYYNRGSLKDYRLSDTPGALADYNQAISLNPKYANAYAGRGLLQHLKLKNRQRAIADLRTAAKLFRAQGQTQSLQKILEILRFLGATENT
jgi:tetratricopeptide (TPR) repeat protein